MIRLSEIKKTYVRKKEYPVLKGVNITVKEGEMLAIMGPSGSGKTTLLSIIAGLDTATEGVYTYNDEIVSSYSNAKLTRFRRDHISYISQGYSMIEDYTIMDNLELPLIIKGVKSRERKAICENILERISLEDIKNKYPEELSGGELQRCAVARALVADKELVLADEPTGNLDFTNSKMLIELFKEFNKNSKTIIIVTHDKMVADMCDRCVFMRNGKIYDE